MKNLMVLAGILALMTNVGQAESLFRWVDSEGKVHYGDRPATDAVKIEEKKFTLPVASDEDTLPYETRRAKQNFPVTLYVTEDCGEICVQARAMLNKRGIPYVEKLLASKEDIEAFLKFSGSGEIPTLAVGKIFLKGFEAGQWGSELDIAGYSKTAPYGARPVMPSIKPAQAESSVEAAVPAE